MDFDGFIERASIMEFDGGLSRFEAETLAAQAQGMRRHEVIAAFRERNSARRRDRHQAVARQQRTNNLPGVQPNEAEENRPMPQCDQETGRDRLALLALRGERGEEL